ncbi:MAG: AAA family ATPase [Pyrinomonadaceae bacterium]
MSSANNSEPRRLKRANDVFEHGLVPPPLLFDEFWREGELAMLFGPAGVGKSLLAVEVADALARGRPLKGLRMPTTRRNVLYVDLVLSDAQFGLRYSCEGSRAKMRRYKFSTQFFRDRPKPGSNIAEWLRRLVVRDKINVVVIDDLSIVSQSNDGTRETLELTRTLRQMTHELGISVLVLADSLPNVYAKDADEHDLRRTRILCAHADSVFSLSPVNDTKMRHLIQTRMQAGDLAWTHRTPAHFRLTARDDGFVGFDFIEPEYTPEQIDLIHNIHLKRLDRKTFRSIAEEFDISKSSAERLASKWTPAVATKYVEGRQFSKMQAAVAYNDDCRDEDADESEDSDERFGPYGEDRWADDDLGEFAADGEYCVLSKPPQIFDPSRIPFAAALRRPTIFDLEHDYDHNGNQIFVESRQEHSGKPRVWYQRRSNGIDFARFVRDGFGTSGKTIGPSPFLSGGRQVSWPRPSARMSLRMPNKALDGNSSVRNATLESRGNRGDRDLGLP